MILPVYFKHLNAAPRDETIAAGQEAGIKEMVRKVFDNDFAVKMGKGIFRDSSCATGATGSGMLIWI